MKLRKRIMACLLSGIMMLTNVMPVAAAEQSNDELKVQKAYVLTVEKTGEGVVTCSGEGVTPIEEDTYSVIAGTTVTTEVEASEGFTWKAMFLNDVALSEKTWKMPEQDSTLKVEFEKIPEVEEPKEEPVLSENIITEEVLPEIETMIEESTDLTDDEYVLNSKGIKVKKSLLCEDSNCLEEHVGVTLDPTTLPAQEVSLPYSQFISNSDERILEDVYVGMKTSGSNCAVRFWGTPGTGTGHFELRINDGGLSGATGTGWCLNHGAANPGEYNWVTCTYEATCTSVSGNIATWSVTATPPGVWDGESFINGLPAGYQRVGMNVKVTFEEAKGNLDIIKVSAKPEITNGNSNYSLQGAVYGLFQNGKEVARASTDKNGKISFTDLKKGGYTLKELTAPKGYALDINTYNVTVESGKTVTKRVTDKPQSDPVSILLGKVDAETNANKPQGTATLEDAEFTIKYYAVQSSTDPALSGNKAVRTWVLKTNSEGKTAFVDRLKVSGDEFYKDSTGANTLPLGTITIQETKAPKGYLLNSEVFVRQITSKGNAEGVQTYNMPTVPETVQKGIIELQKVDSDTQKNDAQGAASLDGAMYDIFLKSEYQAGDNTESASYRQTLTTDEEGKAKSTELPLETYYVIERTSSEGYLVDPEIHEVELTPKNTTDRVFTEKVTSEEEVIRGNVEIIKFKENLDSTDENLIGLEGVEFTFTSDTTGKVVKKIVTDKTGFATTADKDNPRGGLVYDTYTVSETKCPEGLKPIKPFKVTIKEEGVTIRGIYKEDKVIVSPVSVVKVDASTGNVIPVANAEFRLLDENKQPVTMTTYYPNKVEHTTFKTDANGQFTFPEKLQYGTYYLEEVKAPQGYLRGDLLEFKVTEMLDWTNPLVVKYADENAMGKITIQKTDSDNGVSITGAVFEIRAAEDIVTPDGTVRVKKGELVDTITTDKGVATTKALFLGKYEINETKAAPGYVLGDQPYTVELKYKDQNTAIVTGTAEIKNKPTEIEILKVDDETEEPMKGVTFRIWQEPTTEFDQRFTTDEDGIINVKRLKPGKYFIQEIETLPGYVLNDEIIELTIDEDGLIDGEDKAELVVGNTFTKIDFSKHDLTTGKEIEGGKYQIVDQNGRVIDEWTGTKEPHRITRLVIGQTYLFREISAPYGYLIGQDVKFTVENTGNVQKVKMYDELAMGTITVQKTDKETNDPISGAVFEVKAAEDIVTPDGTTRVKKGELVDTITTDKGVATTKALFLGKYEINETKAAPGFVLGDQVYSVELKYKDQNTAIVTGTAKIKNRPTEIKILKVDGETEEPLAGVTFKIWNKDMESEIDNGIAVADELVTDKNGMIVQKRLAPGTYRIQEVKTVPGYVLNDEIFELTIDEEGLIDGKTSAELIVGNNFTKIDFSKHDLTTGKEIEGGKYQVLDQEGMIIDEWTGAKEPHRITRLVIGQTYIFREIAAPYGYLIGLDVEFTIENTGNVQKVKMYDELAMGTITVQKTDKETNDPISGAVFEVKAAEDIITPDGTTRVKKGELVDTITTDKGVATTKALFLGKYEIKETKAAPGFVLGDQVYGVELKYKDQSTPIVTETVDVTNTPTTIFIQKNDKISKEPLEGIKYQVWNKKMDDVTNPKPNIDPEMEVDPSMGFDPDANVDGSMGMKEILVTDENGQIVLKYLAPGTYYIQEVETLPGYVLDDTIHEFIVNEEGKVIISKEKEPENAVTLTFENDFTKLEISKQDATTGKELPGAKLELIEKESGKVIDQWTSGKEPHYLEKLVPGEYILKETFAPRGYLIAEEITFTLKETGDVQKVVMKDEYSVGGLKPKLPGNGGDGNNFALRTGDSENGMYWIIFAFLSVGAVMISSITIYKSRRKEGNNED